MSNNNAVVTAVRITVIVTIGIKRTGDIEKWDMCLRYPL
ncbi:hypothetical protein J2750_000510 [Methanococcoides alaskense]|uniref:Uncharacterized protein n=1 Tax=Methanococcoides alaskense TaxID=325778 RepID=A0AA90TXU1_9EURY|nr:hypothetical protein [Methanococcoides alaskense]